MKEQEIPHSHAAAAINGDLAAIAFARSESMPWAASPGNKVWRRRLHLVGAAESGQVTSIVRFEGGSSFPNHPHPEGEEILVLEGVFSDEQGDWPAGSFLLNPEGFRHAPFSQAGCRLFVKLRQAPGTDRTHIALNTGAEPWQPTPTPGIEQKVLYRQAGFSDTVCLERWRGAQREESFPGGVEIFVLEGELLCTCGSQAGLPERLQTGDWVRLPAGARAVLSADAAQIYCKRDGLRYLRSAPG